MDHKIDDVQRLYDDSASLYNNVVKEKADGIINNLNRAINTLKNSWEGKDAGVQINNVVDVYNAMIKIRNALANLSKDSTTVASGYREIQNANRANFESLAPITTDGDKPDMSPYQDDRDTINITTEAINGKALLDSVNNAYEEFKSDVNRHYQAIMENWKAGFGRDDAEVAFNDFMNNANKYKSILEDVSRSITDAIRNYKM